MHEKPKVLIVDDDDDIRYALSKIFKKCYCVVKEIASVEAALEELSTTQYDIVFSDMWFHGSMGGEELLDVTTKKFPNTKVALISCSMDAKRSAELKSKGAACCLEKPFFKETCIQILNELYTPQKKAA